jgi:hypothetical protein
MLYAQDLHWRHACELIPTATEQLLTCLPLHVCSVFVRLCVFDRCKKFYFGGRRDCEQNAAAEVRPDNEFVCYDCADLKSIKCRNKDHAEFQVWKCRFCCNLASWFCFGTTHYCQLTNTHILVDKETANARGQWES